MFRHTGFAKQLILLLALPLAVSSTGYALFSQKLTLNNQTAKPLYNSSQYMYATYTKTESAQGANTLYTYNPTTITNKGVTGVTAWQLKFDVPADTSQLTCPTSVTCTRSVNTVTVVNGIGNGTLAAGGSTTFAFSFVSATAKYVLQNVYISGTYSSTYQTISGLTVSRVAGTSSKKGSTFTYPYTFTVTNSTGQNLSAWQAVCTWSALPTSSTIDTTVNYVTASANITFSSKTALNTGSNIVFNGSFVINSSTWTISTCTVQGRA